MELIGRDESNGKEFVTPKVTEQYPENRKTLKIADRFRGTLTLIEDETGITNVLPVVFVK